MSQQAGAFVTAADISRLAGVTRATVSNWRRRHPDFPGPTGGTDTSPTYDLEAVRSWLSARGQLPETSSADELRIALRAHPDSTPAASLLPVVLAAARLGRDDLAAVLDLPDDELSLWAHSAASPLAAAIPGVPETTAHDTPTRSLLRPLVRYVHSQGAAAATEILAERLLDGGGTGTYVTPEPLADLMARLLSNDSDTFPAGVLDPACGSGTLLTAAARAGATRLFGQDILTGQAAQTAVRLRLSGPTAEITVRAGDSLRSDAFPGLSADAVLCNPPYGDREWGHGELAYDQRWAYGVPPKGEPELAWIQHCLSHLAPAGRTVLLMPPAVTERAAGRRIRAQLVRDGALRAIIALPQGAATPLHISLHLWVLERPTQQGEAAGTVLFVDTTTSHVVDPESRVLDWNGLSKTVLTAWRTYRMSEHAFAAIPAIARSVPVINLLDEAVNLTPARHVRASHPVLHRVVLAQQAAESRDRLRRAVTDLTELSSSDGWASAADRAPDWRTATVADLLRGGALDLLHTASAGRRSHDGQSEQRAGHDGPPVLTAADVIEDRPASGASADVEKRGAFPSIQQGDVIVPEIVRGAGPGVARVAESGDEGCLLGPHLLLFRPNTRRLDPWFLAGFLAAEDNISAATTGASIVRVDPRRLRVPLLPLTEQERYGAAFRHLDAMRAAARLTVQAAGESIRLLGAGLTGGALSPPDHGSASFPHGSPISDQTGPISPSAGGGALEGQS